MERLHGKDLLEKLRTLDTADAKEMAAACGYTTQKGRVSLKTFTAALLAANGINVAGVRSSTTRKTTGRQPKGFVTVQGKGQIVIGGAWSNQIGLIGGDKVNISISRGRIVITPEKAQAIDTGADTDANVDADTSGVVDAIADGTDETTAATASFTAMTSDYIPTETTVAA